MSLFSLFSKNPKAAEDTVRPGDVPASSEVQAPEETAGRLEQGLEKTKEGVSD